MPDMVLKTRKDGKCIDQVWNMALPFCMINLWSLVESWVILTVNWKINACFWLFFSLKADEMQDVMHFNYTAWPDHGVPTANAAESILQFVHMVRQQATKSKGPMIIHCR